MTDYLAAAPLIIIRLKAKVPGFIEVDSRLDQTELEALTLRAPAAYVLYDGDQPGDSGEFGDQVILQRYLVLIVVRNIRQAVTGEGIRSEAGPLLAATLAALSGWQPGPGFGRLQRIPGPRPDYSIGYAFYPLLYTIPVVAASDPT